MFLSALLVALLFGGLEPPPSGIATASGVPFPLQEAPAGLAPDSAAAVEEARSAQARFERLRAADAPFSRWSGTGRCDERVGRFCLRFGTDSDEGDEDRPSWTPPPESEAVAEAREELLALLGTVARAHPGDAWVSGQWVAYLIEGGQAREALQAARNCRASGWWCDGLEGMALHASGRTVEAEEAFARVLAGLPDEERRDWNDPGFLVETELYRALRGADGDDEERMRERIWALSHPLFLLEGNSLRTEHLSRWVLSRIREDARNGHAMRWSSDMTQLLVRYGPVIAYERIREPLGHMGPPPVLGRYDPRTRHLIPTAEAVADPAGSRPDDWATHRRQTRSRHAPPTAPRIHSVDAQVARFPRGRDLLIVAAWELGPPGPPTGADSARAREEDVPVETLVPPFPPTDLESALFAVDVNGLDTDGVGTLRFPATRVSGTGHAVLARIAPHPHLLSMEALDAEGRRAWRQRRGVLPPGTAGLPAGISDLLLLRPDTEDTAEPGLGGSLAGDEELPLDSLVHRAHPGTTFAPGPVEVVWEVTGLTGDEDRIQIELVATREDRGLLRRAGEALRILSASSPTAMRWEEALPEGRGTPEAPHLRRVVMDLSSLEEGAYELSLRVTPPEGPSLTTVREVRLTAYPDRARDEG